MKFELLVCFAFLIVAVSCQDEAPGIEEQQPEPKSAVEQKPVICEAGKVHKKECNLCRCSKDGRTLACTRKACVPSTPTPAVEEGRKKRDVSNANEPCTPNTTFKKDCHTCRCNAQGKALCPLSRCPTINLNNPETKVQVCVPKSSYKKGCNSCKCNDEGTFEACTQIACNVPPKNP